MTKNQVFHHFFNLGKMPRNPNKYLKTGLLKNSINIFSYFCSRSSALKIAEFYYRDRRFRSRYPVFEAVNNRSSFFRKLGFDLHFRRNFGLFDEFFSVLGVFGVPLRRHCS